MIRLRHECPNHSVQEAAAASGMTIQKPDFKEYPFQFDNFLTAVGQLQRQGRWHDAAGVYQMMAERHGNVLWMQTLRANALLQAGYIQDAETIIESLNQAHPTAARLMIQARIYRKAERWPDAVNRYQQAKAILDKEPLKAQKNKRPLRTKLEVRTRNSDLAAGDN